MTTRHTGAVSVLVVEDDQTAAQFLSHMIALKYPDSTILSAENGQAGLELFQTHQPDIVVTDIDMPVMDGIEMASRIRELRPGANIIAATAKSDTRYLLNAIRVGIDRYVLKPIDIESLFESMQECIERVTLNRKLQAQNDFIRKLSLAVEQSSNMILIANCCGVIEYVNPVFTEITGYQAGEVNRQNLRSLIANCSPLDTFEMLWSTVNRGFEWRGEFVSRKKGGELICIEASVSPLSTEEGRHFVAVMQDITARNEAREEIRRLNEELEQRVRERTSELEVINKELESFCYSVSHDLRTPLRGMSGFCSILMEDYGEQLDETGKEYLRRVVAAAANMGKLIDDILDLSRVTRSLLCFEQIDLSAMVREIVDTLGEHEPDRAVEVRIANGVEAFGDATLLRQVLGNLLGNAWKYTAKQPNPRIEFGSSRVDGEKVYFVADNGIGFDMAYVSRIFKPFERLHRPGEFEGTGIGLASVERIVSRHGGRVWAEGKVGKGAKFYFTLS